MKFVVQLWCEFVGYFFGTLCFDLYSCLQFITVIHDRLS
jgi:hypothetical protein